MDETKRQAHEPEMPDLEGDALTAEQADFVMNVGRLFHQALIRGVVSGAQLGYMEIRDGLLGDAVKGGIMVGLTPRAARMMSEAAERIGTIMAHEDDREPEKWNTTVQ